VLLQGLTIRWGPVRIVFTNFAMWVAGQVVSIIIVIDWNAAFRDSQKSLYTFSLENPFFFFSFLLDVNVPELCRQENPFRKISQLGKEGSTLLFWKKQTSNFLFHLSYSETVAKHILVYHYSWNVALCSIPVAVHLCVCACLHVS
jgi:hypothetical protein